MAKNSEIEVRVGSVWVRMPVTKALQNGVGQGRCPECYGTARIFRGSKRSEAHFRHIEKEYSCSLSAFVMDPFFRNLFR